MFILIEKYIDKLTINDLNNLALNKDIHLSPEELDFSYHFIKKNWQSVLSNYNLFDINKYKNMYSEENFIKIKKLIREYTIKYGHYLK